MTSVPTYRDVATISSPPIQQGMSPRHRIRALLAPGNPASIDPFLVLMEDWYPEGVFDNHPHRGIETVTYVLEGSINHHDNHGQVGSIGPGDALWLTAGRGIIHNEHPGKGQVAHVLQLWVNLPRAHKLVPAALQELRGTAVPTRREPGAELRVFSGASGAVVSSTHNYVPVLFVEARLEPDVAVEQEVPGGYRGFVVVLEGEAQVGSSARRVAAGQLAWLTDSPAASTLTLRGGTQGLRALVIAGRPLGEPVASHGPFVMNTPAEIQQAFADYQRQGEQFGR